MVNERTTTGVAEAVEALREADEDEAFWTGQFERLVREFPDQFVAAHNGEVVATAAQLEDLLSALSARGLDPQQVRIRFIASDPCRYLL